MSEKLLIDGESGKVVHPDSTITMPLYEFDKILRDLDAARLRLAERDRDAERYRWLRTVPAVPNYLVVIQRRPSEDVAYFGDDLDRVVDAAIAAWGVE